MTYRIKLIGFDSMGSRGMATVIEIYGVKLFIDPGVSYAPRRYGLPPHPIEMECFREHLDEIHREVSDATHIVISHYHRDHYLYRDDEKEYYKNKILFIKDPERNINVSQKMRAHRLLKSMGVRELAKQVLLADSSTYTIDKGFTIEFSKPAPHGAEGTHLGYVVMTFIKTDNLRLLHASDVQGPMNTYARQFIVEKDPDILIISGPPTYFEEFRISKDDLNKAINNMLYIIEKTRNLRTIILDHHLLRDPKYKDKIRDLYNHPIVRERKVKILTAAEYMGVPIRQLEAMRKELWEKNH